MRAGSLRRRAAEGGRDSTQDYSPEADALLVSVQDGDGGEFSHYVSRPDGGFTQLTRFKDGVDFAAFGPDAALYLVSEPNAPRRRILKLAPGVRDLAKATTIVPQGEDAIPINFFGEDPLCFVGKRMYVRFLAGGPTRLRAFALDGTPAGDVALPDVAAVDELEPLGSDLLYSVGTDLTPVRFYRLSGDRSTPKSARSVLIAGGKPLIDFGLRRAHGAEAGLLAGRASYLAGFSGTATVLAGMAYGIPLYGTMAHSFVQAHADEAVAFEHFAQAQPDNVVLLIDTYDTEAAAYKVVALAPVLKAKGITVKGVRLDSGDLADHARKVRRILDEGGLPHAQILASGNLDEYRLNDLI